MDKNIEVLQEVLNLLEEERIKFYDLINQNDFRIEEINSYLKELSKNEEDDYKVFSPRNAENRHREEIETDISEKKKFEKENIVYKQRIEYLKLLINKVNIVVDNLKSDYYYDNIKKLTVSNKKNIEEDDRNVISDTSDTGHSTTEKNTKFDLDKKHIVHRILNCVSFIPLDPERAKIELTSLAEKIKKY